MGILDGEGQDNDVRGSGTDPKTIECGIEIFFVQNEVPGIIAIGEQVIVILRFHSKSLCRLKVKEKNRPRQINLSGKHQSLIDLSERLYPVSRQP